MEREKNQSEQGSIDTDLKSLIEKNVLCVDFQLTDGEPVLELELNSREIVSGKLIDVKRPPDTGAETLM